MYLWYVRYLLKRQSRIIKGADSPFPKPNRLFLFYAITTCQLSVHKTSTYIWFEIPLKPISNFFRPLLFFVDTH